MGLEFELKFRCDSATQETLRAAVAGEETVFRMETTYYDTPKGDLSARRWTLRRRQENEKSVCTLKFPVEGDGRGEFELECDSIETAIPELCKLSGLEELASLCEKGVVAVCGAKFTRIAKTFDFAGTVMEMALDQGVLTGGGREVPLSEMELELKEGDAMQVRQYAAILMATYPLETEPKSKFRRALDLAKGE